MPAGVLLAKDSERDGHLAPRNFCMQLVEDGALRFSPHARPGDVLDRHNVAVLGLLQELLDERRVCRDRRVLVAGLGVAVHEGRIVLDAVVAREVAEGERPDLPEKCDAPKDEDMGEYAGEAVAFLEGLGYYGGIELLPVVGSVMHMRKVAIAETLK